MLHAGLDLSRRRLDICLLDERGELVARLRPRADADGCAVSAACRGAGGAGGDRVDERRAVRARHARGARLGSVDRRRAEGQGPGAAGVQDRQDRRAGAGRAAPRAIWSRRSGCRTRAIRRERELARFRLHLVRHRTTLKNRIHATLVTFGHPCRLGSVRPRRPRAARPPRDPRSVAAQRRRQPGADRRPETADRAADGRAAAPGRRSPLYPLLVTAPGFGWINAYTVASEIGDIERFPSPAKLAATPACARA